MLIRAGFDLTYRANAPTPMISLLSIRPERRTDLRTQHLLANDRSVAMDNYSDGFGNVCTRLRMPQGVTTLSCDFIIEDCGLPDPYRPSAIQHDVSHLPADVVQYLSGSRYCETDLLSNEAWRLFGHIPEGWQRVQAIVDFVHGHLTYGYPFARATRTAAEAYDERVGVCRDFAHLAVTLCRCLNIPARYCSGYLGDIGIDPVPIPMDFHAWFEVFLGGAWHSFDARHRVPRIGRILMACGRDAADTALTTAFGAVDLIGFQVHTGEVRSLDSAFLLNMAA
jgi:transglutaminase-like putative cysteine protease